MGSLDNASGSAHLELYLEDEGASVVYRSSSHPRELEVFTDILFSCSFAIRQMVNVSRRNPIALDIAQELRTYFTHWDLERLVLSGVSDYSSRGKTKRHFVADLTYDIPKSKPVRFTMHPKGFGFMSRDVERFVGPSVTALIVHLAQKYQSDSAALVQLSEALELSGRVFLEQEIGVQDQQSLAMTMALIATDLDDESNGSSNGSSIEEFGRYACEVLEATAAIEPSRYDALPDKEYAEEEFHRIRDVFSNDSYDRISSMRPSPPLVVAHRALFAFLNATIGAVGDALGVAGEAMQGNAAASTQYERNYRNVSAPEIDRRWLEFSEDLQHLSAQHPDEYQRMNIPMSLISSVQQMVAGNWSQPLVGYRDLP